jgi:TonB family protein
VARVIASQLPTDQKVECILTRDGHVIATERGIRSHLLKTVRPEPRTKGGFEGVAILDVIIDASGNVTSVSGVRGDGAALKNTADAVRRWRFTPFEIGGTSRNVEARLLFIVKSSGEITSPFTK